MADFYPGIDASYKILKPVKVYASINQSFRMPTFTDLFYVGPENLGNHQLKPEKATTYEGGLKILTKHLHGNASVFYRKGTDIIAWTKANPQDAVWQPNNITELNTLGIEAQGRMNTAPFLMNAVYWLRDFHLGYLYLDVTRNSNQAVSRYAMDHLNQKLTAGFDVRLYKWLYSNWQLNYQQRNGEFQQYNFDSESFDTFSYEPFATLDARIYAEIKSIIIYAEASNIFDEEFYDIGGVPQPDRWIRAGVKATLNFNNF
jgi:iron complex outermembrane receptor protein